MNRRVEGLQVSRIPLRKALLVWLMSSVPLLADGPVELLPLPEGGLQPEALLGTDGSLHLLYFSGEPIAGNLFYSQTRIPPAADQPLTLGAPVRVNSQDSSVIAMGTVRGGHLALGAGRVHVAWMSADREDPGMYYARSDGDDRFEAQQNVTQQQKHLDGGGSLAVDESGRVHVSWHAGEKEATRAVWVATSSDSGRTFSSESQANPVATGACGCCGMRTAAGSDLFTLYRAATAGTERGMQLLYSHDSEQRQVALDEWMSTTCPMSTASIHPNASGALLAWEKAGQIWWTSLTAGQVETSVAIPGDGGSRKHPSITSDETGQILVAWAEGTRWARGGDLAWQLYSPERVARESGRLDGAIEPWSRAAVVARPGGGFYVIH